MKDGQIIRFPAVPETNKGVQGIPKTIKNISLVVLVSDALGESHISQTSILRFVGHNKLDLHC